MNSNLLNEFSKIIRANIENIKAESRKKPKRRQKYNENQKTQN